MARIGILIVTKGRESILDTLSSITKEIRKEDEVVVVTDGEIDVPSKHPQVTVIKSDKLGFYGHPNRQKYQGIFDTEYIMNVDDDDTLNPGWRRVISVITNTQDPDLIIFNYYDVPTKSTALRATNYRIAPITGNVVFRNAPEITGYPWGNFVGGDTKRVNDMRRDMNLNTYISEFSIMNKN